MVKIVASALLAILIPIMHFSHLYLNEKFTKRLEIEERKFNLPSPEITKTAALGYDNLIADLLWLQFIQYVGGIEVKYLPEMSSLLNNIVTLDPKFLKAYIFGAHCLSDNKEFDKAVVLLDKGIKELPEEWDLPYQMGFIYYIKKKNRLIAAKYLDKAGDIAGAPLIMKRLAALLYTDAEGSDMEVKIKMWESALESAKKQGDKISEEKAYKQLVELKIEFDVSNLEKAIAKYNELRNKKTSETVYPDQIASNKNQVKITAENETSKMPYLNDLQQLVDNKILTGLPMDPLGRPYMFEPQTQKIKTFPLPWK